MKKIFSRKYILLLFIAGMIPVCLLMERNEKIKMIAGYKYEYQYYKRRLTIDDFQQFGYETTYSEVIESIGEENGDIGENYFYPYYELCDGTYAIVYFNSRGSNMQGISIADKKEILYFLLPRKIPRKNAEEKERELLYAKQYEMNIIMDLLGIKKWKKPEVLGDPDDPIGIYSEEALSGYTNMDLYIKIDYEFENYESSNDEPLLQTIKVYRNNRQCGSAQVAWNCCFVIGSELLRVEEIAD